MFAEAYMRFAVFALSLLVFTLIASGCYTARLSPDYQGPVPRSEELESYYSRGDSYQSFQSRVISVEHDISVQRFDVATKAGAVVIDYFAGFKPSEELILVFPVLGGRYIFERYFARYFAQHGIDTAIVHRDKEFKNPENFDRLEAVFRNTVVRDRIALDFFEKELGKKAFGSFGISRGAMNAALTAGIDSRLRYNVLALGGADLSKIFRDSGEPGVLRYKKNVMSHKGISESELYQFLEQTLRSDPKWVAHHIDARDTLMFLSLFDDAVPLKYGQQLRESIGKPRTVYLFSGHYTALAFTQFVRILPPTEKLCVFPLDYVETESLAFFRKSFKQDDSSIKRMIFQILQAPLQVIGELGEMCKRSWKE